jgi:hypothetical protein
VTHPRPNTSPCDAWPADLGSLTRAASQARAAVTRGSRPSAMCHVRTLALQLSRERLTIFARKVRPLPVLDAQRKGRTSC